MVIPKSGIIGKVAIREAEASVEMRDHIEIVRDAVNEKEKVRTGDDDAWTFVDAIYSDRVIIEDDGRYFEYSYSVDEERNVTLGERTEVIREFTPVEASKQINTAMIEAVKDSEGNEQSNVYNIRVIRAGASRNKRYYSDVCLREAAPLFEGVRVFIKSDEEHLKRQGKSVRNLIGGLREPVFIPGAVPDSGQIQAKFDVFESVDEVAGKLKEAVARKMNHLFGFSVDVTGYGKPRGDLIEAVKFVEVKSVDLIIDPGAGGELINLIEAIAPSQNHEEETMLKNKMLDRIRKANGGKLPPGLDENDELAVLEAFTEAVSDDDSTSGTASVDSVTKADLDAFKIQISMREAVDKSRLPDAAKKKLKETLSNDPELTLEKITEAIDGELDYLAQFTDSGKPSGLGVLPGDSTTGGVQEMMTKLFDPADREVISIRECYQEATGDKHVTGRLSNCRRMVFTEAVSSTTFPDLLGDEMNRRMTDRYNGENRFDIHERLISANIPFTDFRNRKSSRVGGYGELPIVAENGAYTPLTTPGEEPYSYGPQKRGGIETVSLEAIKNDDVGLITKIPRKLGTAAKRTFAKFVLEFVRTNPVIYDGVSLFHASHNNLQTAALSGPAYQIARKAMKDQVELGVAAERMGIAPALMLYPGDLEDVAFDIFQRGTNVDKDFVQSNMPFLAEVWYWTDPNDWVLIADPNDVDLIEVGFMDDQREPELFIQDSPSHGSVFTNDQITYKMKHVYGGVPADFRGFNKSVVV